MTEDAQYPTDTYAAKTLSALDRLGIAPAWTEFGNSCPVGNDEALASVRFAYRVARERAGTGPVQWAGDAAYVTSEAPAPKWYEQSPVWSEEQAVARWWNGFYRHGAAVHVPDAEAAVRADLGSEWANRLLPATRPYGW